jgi:hypothetical protein
MVPRLQKVLEMLSVIIRNMFKPSTGFIITGRRNWGGGDQITDGWLNKIGKKSVVGLNILIKNP